MNLDRLRSLLLVPCAAAMLTLGCGQGNTLLSPTAPTGTIGSTALITDGTPDMATTASSGGDFTTLEKGGNGKDKGKGGGDSSESDSDESHQGVPGGPSHGDRGELSGFVTAVTGDSLTVRGITVMVEDTTLIRHGNRILTIADIHVGDHVQARGILDGTTLVASEIKVEDTDHDDDDGEGNDEADVKGTVSGLTGTCPSVTFNVSTTSVTTNSSTVFDGVTCEALTGALVEVEGERQSNGSILATEVELESGPDEVEGTVSQLDGTCPSVSFKVKGTVVSTSGTTTFTGVTCAAIANGTKVEVEGTLQPNGSIAAASVELD
jgi:hypothetical protein